MTMTVRVMHNIHEDPTRSHIPTMDGYRTTDELTTVAVWHFPNADALGLLERVFTLGNMDPELITNDERGRDLATAYRARRNRSLSVGDVVTVDGTPYACQRFGWIQVPGEAVDTRRSVYGSHHFGG